jgi:hypothetical protein
MLQRPVRVPHHPRPVISVPASITTIEAVHASLAGAHPFLPRPAPWRACEDGQLAQCRSMMSYDELVPAQASTVVPDVDRLRLAVAAYLARFKDTSRDHTNPDLRCYLTWCAERAWTRSWPGVRIWSCYPVDAGGPPVQALDGVPAVFGHRGFLPDLRHRRRPGALTSRVRSSCARQNQPAAMCFCRAGIAEPAQCRLVR